MSLCLRTNLLRAVVQAEELPVHVQLVDADVSSGRGGVSDVDTAAGLGLLHIHTLPLPLRGADAAAGGGPGHRYTSRGAGRQLQPEAGTALHHRSPNTPHITHRASLTSPPLPPAACGRR